MTAPRHTAVADARSSAAAYCGLAAVAAAVLVPLAFGAAAPGYSHAAQYISELGAFGAANGWLVSVVGFGSIGALVLAFLYLLGPSLPPIAPSRVGVACYAMVGVAYLLAAMFRCDAGCPGEGSTSQTLHNLGGLAEYIGAIAGLRFFALAFRADEAWQALAPLCLGLAFVIGVAFIAMLAPELAPYRGLSQRVAEAAVFGWIGVVSASLLQRR